ncbi:MAG TPA: prolyl oligopeptidase family serine peptidase [Planctomycetota bacterium]|nr:prolyl oligopeptidase family serine peptidase [Planctomycetota bacterium]
MPKQLPLPGETLRIDGCEAFLILPATPSSPQPTPWVLYAPTLRGLPSAAETWMFERFLAAGIAIAGIDVGESYGSPTGRAHYSALYDHLVHSRGLSPRPVLLGRSRGGLMTLAWAADHAESTAAFVGIYPVCDLRSYPGLAKACGAYGYSEAELTAKLAECNPIERLAPLARAGVPLFAIHGDQDEVVPLAQNSAEVEQRYRALGGTMELHVVPGHGHDMFRAFFESEALVAFVLEHARR